MFIQDGSQDKKYFTMIPNYVLNHSSAIDQALYLQMKRIAGENGVCFASKRFMMKQLKIGRLTLNKSLDYLIKHEWIIFVGNKKVQTSGGIQTIGTYRMTNLWVKNINHFEGASESTPLESKVRLKSDKVRLKRPQGASESTTKKNLKKNFKKNKESLNLKEGQKEQNPLRGGEGRNSSPKSMATILDSMREDLVKRNVIKKK